VHRGEFTRLDRPLRRVIATILTTVVCGGLFGAVVKAGEGETHRHWSFQPIQHAVAPQTSHDGVAQTVVDSFILEKVVAAGLSPAAVADKRTLIRRATYDLTGLPPTPADTAKFLTDDSPDAFDRLLDQLLATPRYGERWGRHWLDVARYANTRGDTGSADPSHPFAFTYRDYVIAAFNDDLPYDRFLMEQIAADQLPLSDDKLALRGLGFITVGRHFLNNGHDTIDDRIDVVTRGTMALTVSCARCHDHKYDPIPIEDYYSLYGVFASSNEPNPLPVVGGANPEIFADYQTRSQKLQSDRTSLIQSHTEEVITEYRKQTANFLLASRSQRRRDRNDQGGDQNLQRTGVRRWRKALEKLDSQTDPVFAPWFAFATLPQSGFAEAARELALKITANSLPHPINPLVAAAFAGEPPASLNDVAQRYAGLLDSVSAPTQTPGGIGEVPVDPDREALRKAFLADEAPGGLPEGVIRQLFPAAVQTQIQQLETELGQLDTTHPGAPVRAMALFDNAQPGNARIFIRGNPNNPGDEVPRQFLKALAGTDRQPFAHGSGRLDLAAAITSRQNPLTARVIVNRVWLHHFGTGLVSTPDDFGVRSEPPSHPQVLDELALRLIDGGWSLKKLHRQLMSSHTYQQSSDDGLRSATIDPENHLLSKMNRHRLEFEELRDTLLAVAQNLDDKMDGRAVFLTPQPKVSAGGGFEDAPVDPNFSRRRAIYGFIDRQNVPGLFRAFDFADPDTITGRRYATTVPQQALFFFNNPFVMQQAVQLAADSANVPIENDQRIRSLYQQLFQREPTDDELSLANQFLSHEPSESAVDAGAVTPSKPDQSRNLRPWERLVHVLLMADELMFVD